MQELPRDFLVTIARNQGLTPLEEEAFIETFARTDTDQVLIKHLKLSLSAYRTRMGNVYRKFSFGGVGAGKKARLQYFLWEEFKKKNPTSPVEPDVKNIDSLIDDLNDRVSEKIRSQCGSMRILDMSQPVLLPDIFTEVNILEKLSHHQRLNVDDLMRNFDLEADNFDRFGLSRPISERTSGVELVQQRPKLIVLGKPGAGKTTFLKYLAMQCSHRQLFADYLPVFITLKDFAEADEQPSLLNYIIHVHQHWDVRDREILMALQQRRMLLLLDGLDEVRNEDVRRIIQQIETFTKNFHGNRFVLTCRVAAQEYVFEQFTEVEIADFNFHQIQTFVRNWFQHRGEPSKGEDLLNKLNQSSQIQELATNPLLLTLLCIVFEEQADFPESRSELYDEGINTLLKKWDASRNIERPQIYRELSVPRKLGMLGQIALKAFEKSEIFFSRPDLISHISGYVVNLSEGKRKQLLSDDINHDSAEILRSIEAQHGLLIERARGIYSFSHLCFQEYFTAKAIASVHDLEPLQPVFEKVRYKAWREVFLLATNMAHSADGILIKIKQEIDGMPKASPALKSCLDWLEQKTNQLVIPVPRHQVCLFYYRQILNPEPVPAELPEAIHSELHLDYALLTLLKALDRSLSDPSQPLADLSGKTKKQGDRSSSAPATLRPLVAANLQLIARLLNQRPSELPGTAEMISSWREWEQRLNLALADSDPSRSRLERSLVDDLRAYLIGHRHIGHAWPLDESASMGLQQYYNGTLLLLSCLDGDCYVSQPLQRQIKAELFIAK